MGDSECQSGKFAGSNGLHDVNKWGVVRSEELAIGIDGHSGDPDAAPLGLGGV